MKTHTKTLLAASTALLMGTTAANAAILSIDFGNGPVESGFVGQSSGSVTHSTTAGDITVATSGQQGFFNRANPSDDDFYRDFVFDNNSNGFTITLSGAGIAASTDYILTFYGYDSGEVRDTTVTAISGTTGPQLSSFAETKDAPASLETHALTATYTSNTSGQLVFQVDGSVAGPGVDGRSAINGLVLDAVPEPGSLALLGLGGLLIGARRRR